MSEEQGNVGQIHLTKHCSQNSRPIPEAFISGCAAQKRSTRLPASMDWEPARIDAAEKLVKRFMSAIIGPAAAIVAMLFEISARKQREPKRRHRPLC